MSDSTAPPQKIPPELEAAFTLDGRIPVADWYFNDKEGTFLDLYTVKNLRLNIDKIKAGGVGYYPETDQLLYQVLTQFPIKGKHVLVFGSAKPWYEAVCFAFGCASCTVLEYNIPDIDYPNLSYHLPESLEGKKFDAALSISSFEHDGLGRYGDPVRPDQDLKAMQNAKALLKEDGILYLAIPIGKDLLVWNAHRIYGRIRLPLMLQGWRVEAMAGMEEEKLDQETKTGEFQPILILTPNSHKQTESTPSPEPTNPPAKTFDPSLVDENEHLTPYPYGTLRTLNHDHIQRYALAKYYADGRDVLDAAMGCGYSSMLFNAKSYTGFDIDQNMVAFAEQYFAPKIPNAQYKVGDVTKLPVADHSIDTYISYETIEHIRQDQLETYFSEAKRVLRPEGLFLCSTPIHRGPEFGLLARYHMFEFNYGFFEKCFEQRGFQVIETWYQHPPNYIPVKDVPSLQATQVATPYIVVCLARVKPHA